MEFERRQGFWCTMFFIKEPIKEWVAYMIPREWIIWNGERIQVLRRVALTFDDGPNPEYTPQVLDILKDYKIKATFFLLGQEVERFKDLTRRIVDEGHSIGNHSYSHSRFNRLGSKEIEKEILKTQHVFDDVFGKENRLFRPPQGILSLSCLRVIRRLRLTTVLWSRELDNGGLASVRSGDIILLHDDNDSILKALPALIEDLKKRCFDFVTIEHLLQK